MTINPALAVAGKTLGALAVVGTAAGIGSHALITNTEGKTHDVARAVATGVGAAALMAFYFTPGLPNKPIAAGALGGLAIGTMFGLEKGTADAKAAANAVQ